MKVVKFAAPVVAVIVLVVAYLVFWSGGDDALVVYCAHDSVYSSKILEKFQEKTGIKVVPRFDTEATKSLGLIELLIREKDNPRCDVFWNNELLGTMDLKERDVLQPYKGSGYKRIPAAFKDADGYWTGFGARLRVFIVNTEKIKNPTEAIIADRMKGDLSRFCIAKPLYGTTLTHYSCLWRELGGEGLKKQHEAWQKRGMVVVKSNGSTKNGVATGAFDFGWTDTDDYFVAKDEKQPVTALPVRLANGKTICIPNTVSIINGTKNLSNAEKLVDFLLSEECELALANSASRQIPLGPVAEDKLPDDVKDIKKWGDQGVDLNGLSEARSACIKWLKSIY